jgi:hypothetical protein
MSARAGPPSIGLKNGAAAAFEGDKLVAEVTMAGFPGFVYADLYDGEGNVVHLLPNARDPKNQVQPGQRLVVGDDAIFGMTSRRRTCAPLRCRAARGRKAWTG